MSSNMNVVIIGGGGNTAEITGSMLLLKGFNVRFYRFPCHIPVPGTPPRPPRSIDRLTQFAIETAKDQREYSYHGKAEYTDLEGIKRADMVIIAMPSYMMERLPSLLPGAFSNKIVVSLCERFLNTPVFLRELSRSGQTFPRLVISHKSDPFNANKVSRDGVNRLWSVKQMEEYHVSDASLSDEAIDIMTLMYGPNVRQWKQASSLWDLAFQNVNAVSHAVTDLPAIIRKIYVPGSLHYTNATYTPEIISEINSIIDERNLLAERVMGRTFDTLADYEGKAFATDNLKSELATTHFRFESQSLGRRPAPEFYRASGFEDVGWSLVPLEEVGKYFGVEMPHTSALIDKWSRHFNVSYRTVGRQVGDLIQTLPADVQRPAWLASHSKKRFDYQ